MEQEVLALRIDLAERFGGEIVEHGFGGQAIGTRGAVRGDVRRLHEEDQPCGPPVGALVERRISPGGVARPRRRTIPADSAAVR